MIISLDTECTGLDLAHGAMPFLVTTCDKEGTTRYWEWDVDPITRVPEVLTDDVEQIQALIDGAELIYLQNAKYDCRALATVGITLPWEKVRDTLVMGHLLATNHRHDLTWMCMFYLGVDIEPLELEVKRVTQACRKIVKAQYPDWNIAEEGKPGMPSVKSSSSRDEDKPWKNDMWLPRALTKELGKVNKFRLDAGSETPNQKWLEACANYANGDSQYTLLLGLEMERLIRERGYWSVYLHRLNLPRVFCEMEEYGVTARGDYTQATIREYEEHVAEAEYAMRSIAREYGHDLELAAGAALNDNMRDFFYGAVWQECPVCGHTIRVKHWNKAEPKDEVCPKCLKRRRDSRRIRLNECRRDNLALPVIRSKTGGATMDKEAMEQYVQTLDGPPLQFMELLADKRKYDTAVGYMDQYRRYWIPVPGVPSYYRIHCSINPCGTDHLRSSSNSPNMQNTSSKDIINTKVCFGPLPDREFWSMDYDSIESRIPAYESGEPKLVNIFERPDEPPYWGKLYYLAASVLYPKEYAAHSSTKDQFKEECPRLYKQCKFFILAKNYGAGRAKGDLLSRVRNSYDLMDNELPRLAALQKKYLRMAEELGYVTTLPDRTVDPEHGYPILASRTDDGRVLTTTPFNYHTSGTACWIKNSALVKCSERCKQFREAGLDAHIAMEVHDEILFDFPRGSSMEENLPRALELQALMEEAGADVGIPSPVAVKYHTESWARGASI